MKKVKYTEPQMEITAFENEDIITASAIITPDDPITYGLLFDEETN